VTRGEDIPIFHDKSPESASPNGLPGAFFGNRRP
jgi:hypothetical protein